MNRVTFYSKSQRPRAAEPPPASPPHPGTGPAAGPSARAPRLRPFLARHERILLVAAAVLLSVSAFLAYIAVKPPPREITQHDVDAAVLHTLDSTVLPSRAAKAYEIVQRSVVRVRQLEHEKDDEDRVRG
ncbi:MAG: S1C family serine protease, partial [Casimicrobiaceae bacterium]